jgi:4-hydroxy-tetrahydrodipicolinate synthase
MRKFVGVIPPVVTAFDSDRRMDLERTKEFIRHLIDKGVHGIFIAGSTGEYTLLSLQERKDLISAGVEAVAGKVPLLAGTGDNNTATAIKLSQFAEEAGADAATVALPHYPKPTQEGLYEHYKRISESISIPLMVYCWPEQHAGLNIEPEIVARLAEEGAISGIKDSSTDIDHTAEIIRLTEDRISVLIGWASKLLPALVLGAAGTVCTIGNVIPEEVIAIYDYFKQGEMDMAREVQLKILPLIEAAGAHPGGTKKALRLIGESVGPSPLPILDAPDAVSASIKEELTRLGKLP